MAYFVARYHVFLVLIYLCSNNLSFSLKEEQSGKIQEKPQHSDKLLRGEPLQGQIKVVAAARAPLAGA